MGRSLRALFRRPVLDALSEDEKSVVIVWIPSRPKRDYQTAGNGRAILVDDANRRGKDSGLRLVMTGFGKHIHPEGKKSEWVSRFGGLRIFGLLTS